MKRESKLYLKDISDSIFKIEEYINNMNFEGFINNSLVYDAVCRNLEIIGEVAAQISKEEYPHVDWREIKDFRNVLAHQYFKVDKEIVWNIIHEKLPLLKKQIEKLLK